VTVPEFLPGGVISGGPYAMTAHWHGDHYSFTGPAPCPGRLHCDQLLTKAETERYGLRALRALNEASA